MVQERLVKREWALKVMIAQENHESRLVALAYQGFKLYVKLAKRHKRLRIKALKLFARTTKKHGFANWKLYLLL